MAERWIAYAGVLILLVTFAGLVLRRRWHCWYAFTAYLAVVITFNVILLVRWVPSVYMAHETVLAAARLAMAAELGTRTFQAFPGARSTLRVTALALLVVTFLLVVAVPPGDYEGFLEDVLPRILNGTVWILTAIAALILWYRLPVSAFNKAILLPYVPYLIWQAVFLNSGLWKSESLLVLCFNQATYLALTARWAWVAWRLKDEAERPTRPFELEGLATGVTIH